MRIVVDFYFSFNPLQTECYKQPAASECDHPIESRSDGDSARSAGGVVIVCSHVTSHESMV